MFLRTFMLVILFLPTLVRGETWIDVGADTEAKYYVDTDSILIEGENTIVTKKGIYTNVLTDKLEGDNSVVFKVTKARLELDCTRELNRVTQIDMVNEQDEVVWSSGYMDKRIWLTINTQGHSRTTFDLVCSQNH
ncbi:MAG: hypothetical protein H2061_07305 [Burkholderiales bacterium]|nr:hypothetical protein [Burkholderiales bacterium]OUT79648.1 MAG: hypothetical protein CBB82_00730 [Betaproteobacteria bacterium TMED22]|tara:strand:- start:32480 stop:32884 length:405 start_codon:yes stop_codon:yes gene_type:complete